MKNSVQFRKKQNFLLWINFCVKVFPLLFLILIISSSCQLSWEIHNPYQDIDWLKHKQYKANFHAHTTISDGSMSPQAVVDFYHKNDYKILAITDHDHVSYSWEKFSEFEPSKTSVTRMEYGLSGEIPDNPSFDSRGVTPADLVYENRNPSALGMIAIQGCELSAGQHHMGSYFNNNISAGSEEKSLNATAEKNGLVILNHPFKYDYSAEWYISLYNRYDHLKGLELYNRGDQRSIEIWDSVLVRTMPGRPVWGFSNDDMHRLNHFGRNWNILILPELNEKWVRYSMENGLFFFVFASEGSHDRPVNPPIIESIEVRARKGTIHIKAIEQDSVVWLSGGKKVYQGNLIDLNTLPEISQYVRAVIYGNGGKTTVGTQPFGVKRHQKL